MQKLLNLKVKYRESFRPFAPSILESRKNSLLVAGNDSKNMASQVEFLIEKPTVARKISLNALNSLKPFSADLVVPEWVNFIKTI